MFGQYLLEVEMEELNEILKKVESGLIQFFLALI